MIPSAYTVLEAWVLQERYIAEDPRTWPFYPITMPTLRGEGPAKAEECDLITYEVWDHFLNSHFSTVYLPEAIEKAMKWNKEVLQNDYQRPG